MDKYITIANIVYPMNNVKIGSIIIDSYDDKFLETIKPFLAKFSDVPMSIALFPADHYAELESEGRLKRFSQGKMNLEEQEVMGFSLENILLSVATHPVTPRTDPSGRKLLTVNTDDKRSLKQFYQMVFSIDSEVKGYEQVIRDASSRFYVNNYDWLPLHSETYKNVRAALLNSDCRSVGIQRGCLPLVRQYAIENLDNILKQLQERPTYLQTRTIDSFNTIVSEASKRLKYSSDEVKRVNENDIEPRIKKIAGYIRPKVRRYLSGIESCIEMSEFPPTQDSVTEYFEETFKIFSLIK